jgi:voltage-gated potassium channel
VFVFEYLTKLYLVPARRSFVTHHVVDLMVIALPMFRPLRGLRLLRVFRVARAGIVVANAVGRGRAILAHRGLQFVLLGVLLIIFVGAALVLAFEARAHGSNIHDFGDALWWAIVTATTVGYGDRYPVTAGGRGVAVVLMLVGIALIGVLTATVASYFVEDRAARDKADLSERLERIEAMLTQVLADRGARYREGVLRNEKAQSQSEDAGTETGARGDTSALGAGPLRANTVDQLQPHAPGASGEDP